VKVIGILLVLLALVLGVVRCSPTANRRACPRAGERQDDPMKCHWTGRAEVAVAVPLAGLGILLAVSRRKETRRALAIVGMLLGLMAALLPLWLIGVCSAAEMTCKMIMEPVLVLAGVVVIVISALALVQSRGPESA